MRDTHDQMIELLEAKSEENVFSSLVRHTISDELLKIRFQILTIDYGRLKNILQFRPFEDTGVAPYRYFLALSFRKDLKDKELAFINVRVEQLKNHKQYEFPISRKYISNLLWINSLHDKTLIEKMIEK